METMEIINNAIRLLTDEDNENAFDILLDEFCHQATMGELKKGILLLENLVLDQIHKSMN